MTDKNILEHRNGRIIIGDAVKRLGDMAENSVQSVITSPPYKGLRSYIKPEWAGGDVNCDHQKHYDAWANNKDGRSGYKRGGRTSAFHARRTDCPRCDAVLLSTGEVGLEKTTDCLAWARGAPPCGKCYICAIRSVMIGVHRVLKNDGIFWLNINDSYLQGRPQSGIKAKSMMLVPERLSLAAQSHGWLIRSRIIWQKPNAMPAGGNISDRPHGEQETIWMMTKSPKYKYNWRACVIKKSWLEKPPKNPKPTDRTSKYHSSTNKDDREQFGSPRARAMTKDRNNKREARRITGIASKDPLHRAIRDVWHMNTSRTKVEHFAPFPEELVRRCMLLATDVGDTVLDPFGGTGTVAKVAEVLNRKWLSIDLDPMAMQHHLATVSGEEIHKSKINDYKVIEPLLKRKSSEPKKSPQQIQML